MQELLPQWACILLAFEYIMQVMWHPCRDFQKGAFYFSVVDSPRPRTLSRAILRDIAIPSLRYPIPLHVSNCERFESRIASDSNQISCERGFGLHPDFEAKEHLTECLQGCVVAIARMDPEQEKNPAPLWAVWRTSCHTKDPPHNDYNQP